MIKTDKQQLRGEIKSIQNSLSEEYIKEASAEIADAFLNFSEYKEAESIFVYISSPNEPDTRRIIQQALTDQKEVYVPKCIAKGEMLAVKITEKTLFSKGYMGLTEPVINDSTVILREGADITVVPCLCACPDGRRLGHGAGFYDRFLEKHPSFSVCLCFSALIREDIPTEKTDIIMNKVLSDRT